MSRILQFGITSIIIIAVNFSIKAQADKINTSVESIPVSMEEMDLLKKTLLWTQEDDKYLKMAGKILEPQLNEILDAWYGYVGANPHLIYYFNSNNNPDAEYLAKVRVRFKQWVLDLCNKPYDKNWLEYQNEIGLRHTLKKGKTDNVANTPDFVHYRYMIAFIYPITVTIKPFLTNSECSREEVERMYNAWFKAVVLSDILWTKPYIKEGQF